MTRYYCTYFDKNYLVKAIALIESLQAHEHKPYQLFAICLDELTRLLLEKLNFPHVIPIPVHRIEHHHEALANARKSRTLVEYYWTLTPTVIHWLLEEYPHIQTITYLDADLYFFSAPEPIFDEFTGHSVLIHEHRFPSEFSYLETYGKYNVGLLCFRRDESGLAVLNWWRERCLEWCHARLENGKFGDQLYLNDWTERFRGVRVLENIGGGVAPWNQNRYAFARSPKEKVTVDGSEIIFYHFHGLTFVTPNFVIPAKYRQYNPMRSEIIELCVKPYLDHLFANIRHLKNIIPDFTFGILNEEELSVIHTFVGRVEAMNEAEQAIIRVGGRYSRMECGEWIAYSPVNSD
jgi:hypothetical protein